MYTITIMGMLILTEARVASSTLPRTPFVENHQFPYQLHFTKSRATFKLETQSGLQVYRTSIVCHPHLRHVCPQVMTCEMPNHEALSHDTRWHCYNPPGLSHRNIGTLLDPYETQHFPKARFQVNIVPYHETHHLFTAVMANVTQGHCPRYVDRTRYYLSIFPVYVDEHDSTWMNHVVHTEDMDYAYHWLSGWIFQSVLVISVTHMLYLSATTREEFVPSWLSFDGEEFVQEITEREHYLRILVIVIMFRCFTYIMDSHGDMWHEEILSYRPSSSHIEYETTTHWE